MHNFKAIFLLYFLFIIISGCKTTDVSPDDLVKRDKIVNYLQESNKVLDYFHRRININKKKITFEVSSLKPTPTLFTFKKSKLIEMGGDSLIKKIKSLEKIEIESFNEGRYVKNPNIIIFFRKIDQDIIFAELFFQNKYRVPKFEDGQFNYFGESLQYLFFFNEDEIKGIYKEDISYN